MKIYFEHPSGPLPDDGRTSAVRPNLLPDEYLAAYSMIRSSEQGMGLEKFAGNDGESYVSPSDLLKDREELTTIRARHMSEAIVQGVFAAAERTDPNARTDFHIIFAAEVHLDTYTQLRGEFELPPITELKHGIVADLGSAVVVAKPLVYRGDSLLESPYSELKGQPYGVTLHVAYRKQSAEGSI